MRGALVVLIHLISLTARSSCSNLRERLSFVLARKGFFYRLNPKRSLYHGDLPNLTSCPTRHLTDREHELDIQNEPFANKRQLTEFERRIFEPVESRRDVALHNYARGLIGPPRNYPALLNSEVIQSSCATNHRGFRLDPTFSS